jgi:hypothetical protein
MINKNILMKQVTLILIFAAFFSSCGLKSKMETHKKAREEADFIIENLTNYDLIEDKLPDKYFEPNQTKAFIGDIASKCDWDNREGKFVDFYSMKNVGGVDKTAFIYEYFLDCDSLRVILTFDMIENSPELFRLNLEQLEKENRMIIDSSKQLLAQ